MPQCLFCRKECEKPSDEHVFPAALGGNLVVRAGACTECNNSFSKAEQLLASELAPIRLIFQIPDRYGNVPQVAATARTPSKEYEARVRGNGTVVFKPIVTEEKDESGRREFVHRFLTDEQKERLRQLALESGHEFVETGPGEPEQAEIHIGGNLKVIGSLEGLRVVAKIAYVGLAYRAGVRFALSDAFDEIRTFIRTGREATAPPARRTMPTAGGTFSRVSVWMPIFVLSIFTPWLWRCGIGTTRASAPSAKRTMPIRVVLFI